MLLDSNIIIYAMKPDYQEVRAFVKQCDGVASAISRTEALGYHDLGESEAAKLDRLFELLTVQSITESVIDRSIELRRRRKSLKTTDAIVAATALELDASLATHNTVDFDWIDELDVIDPVSDG
jgi:predicted nucleic acid-binding protein